MEDAGGVHSNKVGYGLLDIPKKKRSWILLNWKVKIIKRSKYSETLKVKTWSCGMDRLYAIRDFEVFNENNELVVIASSKWVCCDTEKMAITKIDDDIKNAYTIEPRTVFDDKIEKLKEPNEFINSLTIEITKDMLDVNNHVHNLNYIDFASHILPYEIMQNASNIEVMYKKEITEMSNIKCLYSIENDAHIVTIKSEDEKILHAIIKLS